MKTINETPRKLKKKLSAFLEEGCTSKKSVLRKMHLK